MKRTDRTRVQFQGFTLAEALITVAISGTLAGIVAVAYVVVSANAAESSMRSDLHLASTVLQSYRLDSGDYPESARDVNDGDGFLLSHGNTITYIGNPDGYCVSISNPRVSTALSLSSSNREVIEGDCSD